MNFTKTVEESTDGRLVTKDGTILDAAVSMLPLSFAGDKYVSRTVSDTSTVVGFLGGLFLGVRYNRSVPILGRYAE